MKLKTVFVSILFIFISIKSVSANFFKNITDLIDKTTKVLDMVFLWLMLITMVLMNL